MNFTERFRESCRFISSKILWIIFIPILLDLANLFTWQKVYHTVYHPVQKMFLIKIGLIDAPPSVRYLLEDFPTPLFKYDNNGFSGIINRASLFNAALLLTVILVGSFLNSGYMSIIGASYTEKVRIRDFFIKGNKKWHKFFLYDCIIWIPIIMAAFNKSFILLSFISVIFVYVKYSFVVDEVSTLENFKLGIVFLFNNLILTVKIALYTGIIFSLIGSIVFGLMNLGSIGIFIDIVICAYFGATANCVVLGIYAAGGSTLYKEN